MPHTAAARNIDRRFDIEDHPDLEQSVAGWMNPRARIVVDCREADAVTGRVFERAVETAPAEHITGGTIDRRCTDARTNGLERGLSGGVDCITDRPLPVAHAADTKRPCDVGPDRRDQLQCSNTKSPSAITRERDR